MAEIIKKAKAGDEEAFRIIYDMYWRYVLYIATRLCRNPSDAQDVLQDVFLKVFKNLDKLKDPDKIKSWIGTLTTNECYDRIHSNKKLAAQSNEIPEDAAEFNENFLPEAYIANKELKATILKLINTLPQRQREVIYLYYYMEMPTAEIAAHLNTSDASIRKAMHDARKSIKNKIEKDKSNHRLPVFIVAFTSISALFISEEELFAAGPAAAKVSPHIFPSIIRTLHMIHFAKICAGFAVGSAAALIVLVGSVVSGNMSAQNQLLSDTADTNAYYLQTPTAPGSSVQDMYNGESHRPAYAVPGQDAPAETIPYDTATPDVPLMSHTPPIPYPPAHTAPYPDIIHTAPDTENMDIPDTDTAILPDISPPLIGLPAHPAPDVPEQNPPPILNPGYTPDYDFLGWVRSTDGIIIGQPIPPNTLVNPSDIMPGSHVTYIAVWGNAETGLVGVSNKIDTSS